MLGTFADQSAVDQLNHELGTDKPLLAQYWDWISGFFRGDLGTSLSYNRAGEPARRDALVQLAQARRLRVRASSCRSRSSAAWSLLSSATGSPTGSSRSAALPGRRPRVRDGNHPHPRLRPLARPPARSANAPDGSSILTQLKYLFLPALTLVIVLFGYIARITRAGTIEALDADYTRTAVLKGLPRRTVIRRHVLRNSLLPTIAVVATQTGYLIGGLVVIETLFNYPGMGRLIFTAANDKDFPLLESACSSSGSSSSSRPRSPTSPTRSSTRASATPTAE